MTTTVSRSEWLAPTQALARFSASEAVLSRAATRSDEALRHGFRIGSVGLLVPPRTGTEVVADTPLARVPNSSAFLHGILNLRGNLIPVFDLKRALVRRREGAEADPVREAKSTILVFDKADRAAALLIAGFPFVVTGLRPAGQSATLPDPLAQHVSNALATETDMWFEFDHEGLFKSLSGQRS